MEKMVMDDQGQPGWWRPHEEKDAYWDRVRAAKEAAEEEKGNGKPKTKVKEGIVGWESVDEDPKTSKAAEKESPPDLK